MQVIYEFNEEQIKELQELYAREWWTNTRTLVETRACVEGSQICIGIIDTSGRLQGFARVLTDYTFKALVFDVIVSEACRGTGLGDKLMALVMNHEQLTHVKHFELYCLPELYAFYKRWGFSSDVGDITLMRCVKV